MKETAFFNCLQGQKALEELTEEPYASIICYPRSSKPEIEKRLQELRKIGITAVEFAGDKQVFNAAILGKGYVGVVVLAYRKGERAALKIRRIDADRSGMQHEAEMLRKANRVNVGPRLFCTSDNFLLTEFVDGMLLPKWLDIHMRKVEVRKILRRILEQCWRLDNANLDHGELSHAPKHVIIDEGGLPFLVDFETASAKRHPSNVTSICQFLFIGSETAKKIAELLGKKDKKLIVEALRRYKNTRTRENFARVLKACSV